MENNMTNKAFAIVKELEDNGVYSNTPEQLVELIKKAIENKISGQQIFTIIYTNTKFFSTEKGANHVNVIDETLESFGI